MEYYIGLLSGTLVAASAVPYAYQTWQGKIKPNVTTWSLWTLIGLAILVTYDSSGAEDNIWPAVFGFTNPLIIAILAVVKKAERTKLTEIEWWCVGVCLASLLLWFVMKDSRELVQFALYLAIIADAFAAIPTVILVWQRPWDDRPLMWALFGIAYGIAIFAITEHTIANYALPVYMFFGALFAVAMPLCIYRIKNKIPLKEWI